MAWEWSHSPEAYEIARHNLGCESKSFLVECWAEIECRKINDHQAEIEARLECFDANLTDPYLDGRYEHLIKEAKKEDKGQLVVEVWEFAEDHRTCTNGGHYAHVCPEGCHTVSFGSR